MVQDGDRQLSSRNNSEFLAELSTITKGAGVTLVGTVLGKTLLFFYTVLIARWLTQDDFGVYILGTTIIMYLSSVSDLGLNISSTRYVAIYKARHDAARLKGIVITASVITGVVSLFVVCIVQVLSGATAYYIFHEPRLGSVLRVLSVSLPFECLMRTFLRSTQGLKLMHYTALTENVLWILFRIIMTLLLIFGFQMKLGAATWAYTLSSIVCCIMAFLFLNKHIPVFDRRVKAVFETRSVLKFSIPMALSVFLGNVSRQIDILMLGVFVSISELGLYSPAGRLILLAEFVYQVFNPIFNPFVSELTEKKQFTKLGGLLKVITRWNVIMSLPVFLSLIFFPNVFLLLFGQNFIQASTCLVILVLAHLVSSLSSLPSTMIFMSGRSDLTAKNNMLILVLNVGLSYFLIPRYGIVGAAVSTGISLIFLGTLRIMEVYQLMKVHPFSWSLWKPIFAIFLALPVILIPKFLFPTLLDDNVVLSVLDMFVFLFVYSGVVILLRLDKEEIDIMKLVRNKVIVLIGRANTSNFSRLGGSTEKIVH